MLEGLPTKVLNHERHISWCTIDVVSVDVSCGSALYLFQVVDISGYPQGTFSSLLSTFTQQKKRNAPSRTVQLSGRTQVISQFMLYQCKGLPGTDALHIFCKQASKMC